MHLQLCRRGKKITNPDRESQVLTLFRLQTFKKFEKTKPYSLSFKQPTVIKLKLKGML